MRTPAMPMTSRLLLHTLIVLLLVLVIASSSVPVAGLQAQSQEEVKVWVNTNSGIYWCPGSKWYGKTKKGKYMGECEAIKAGYRPAYNKPCGSSCK